MTKPEWKKGDILQIDPDHDEIFGACFMVVTEPKSWGAQGYFNAPGVDGLAYYRVKHEDAFKVGRVEWVPPEDEDHMNPEEE